MSEFANLMEINSIAESAAMEMYLFEHDNFINTMKERAGSKVVTEGFSISKIKGKIKDILEGILKILRKAFDALINKVKEIFSKPIQEASSLSDGLRRRFRGAAAALTDYAYKSRDNDFYICRIAADKSLYDTMNKIAEAPAAMEKDLNKIYEKLLSSTPDSSTRYSTSMMIDDYDIPDEEFINDFFKDNNKHIIAVTSGNIEKYVPSIVHEVADSSIIYKEIQGYKKESDKFIGRMQNIANSLKEDKDTEINMTQYDIFVKSCTTYQKGVIACASGATKIMIKARHQYIRAMFKTIAAANKVPGYPENYV